MKRILSEVPTTTWSGTSLDILNRSSKHTAKDYEPKLTLRNVIGTLADGADVTVRGKYRASDQTINVSNVKVGPAP